MLIHFCALCTVGYHPAYTRPYPPLFHFYADATCVIDTRTLSTWCPDTGPVQRLCPQMNPGAHVPGWGGQRLPLLPQAPRASHLPAVIYQKYINPEPVSIRVSIPGTVPDKPYLCAGALAPCSRACQSCCPHPACGVSLADFMLCRQASPLARGCLFLKDTPQARWQGVWDCLVFGIV